MIFHVKDAVSPLFVPPSQPHGEVWDVMTDDEGMMPKGGRLQEERRYNSTRIRDERLDNSLHYASLNLALSS